MSQFISASVDFDSSVELVENTALVFVDDAEYEFVGGGASVTNGL